jgi:serine/threonine protein kinase
MNRNMLQGRWILAQNWLTKEIVRNAYEQAKLQAGFDLCALLQARGLLSQSQTEQTRQAAALALVTAEKSSERSVAPTPSVDDAAARQRDQTRSDPALFASGEIKNFLDAMAAETDSEYDTKVQSAASDLHDILLPKPGEPFRNYEILAEISRGSQAVIFRARDNVTSRIVALKIVELTNEFSESARFTREAQTLTGMKHPNIVEVFDVGLKGAQIYYAMAELEGESLRKLIKSSLKSSSTVPTWEVIVNYLEGIARALVYCHDWGIIHRDVKPDNIVIESKKQCAVLVDFGLAKKNHKAGTKSSHPITKTGEIIGTPAFMSPEQFAPRGRFGEVGTQSDVWSFGATLYYCLTGNPPFHESAFIKLYTAVLTNEIKAPSALNPDIPDWLNELCMQCLQKKSQLRPTMKVVLETLVEHAPNRAPLEIAKWPLALVGVLVLLLSIALMLIFKEEKPEFLFNRSSGVLTRNSSTIIEGRVNKAHLDIKINKWSIKADGQGYFRLVLPLKKGENFFVVSLMEGDKVLSEKTLTVTQDTETPVLIFNNKRDKNDVIMIDDSMELSGTVTDQTAVELAVKWGSKQLVRLTLSKDGRFSLRVKASSNIQTLTIFAQDSVGNRLIKPLEFKTARNSGRSGD